MASTTSELAHERQGRGERILALDVARGAALLGIVLVHQSFAFPQGSIWNPFAAGAPHTADLAAWGVIMLFLEGCMRATFQILFGAGFLMILSKINDRDQGLAGIDIYARRSVGLLLFGFLHGYVFLWPSDFLYRYGIAALFLLVFRNLPPKWLFIAASFFVALEVSTYIIPEQFKAQEQALAASAAQSASDAGDTLSPEQSEAIETWDSARSWYEGHGDDEIQSMTDERLKGYAANFMRTVPDIIQSHTTTFYRAEFADTMVGMLIGMALFRMSLLSMKVPARRHVTMMAVGYSIGLTTNAFEMVAQWVDGFSYAEFYLNFTTYEIGRVGTAIGHIGLVFVLCRAFPSNFVLKGLSYVGQMTLTNYMLKSVLFAFTFYGFGLGLYGQFTLPELLGIAFVFWAIIVVFSIIWLRTFRYGPAEWLWRSFAEWKWQPIWLKHQPKLGASTA